MTKEQAKQICLANIQAHQVEIITIGKDRTSGAGIQGRTGGSSRKKDASFRRRIYRRRLQQKFYQKHKIERLLRKGESTCVFTGSTCDRG